LRASHSRYAVRPRSRTGTALTLSIATVPATSGTGAAVGAGCDESATAGEVGHAPARGGMISF
jgi:hypothetical protein